jgi:hypothetical protein
MHGIQSKTSKLLIAFNLLLIIPVVCLGGKAIFLEDYCEIQAKKVIPPQEYNKETDHEHGNAVSKGMTERLNCEEKLEKYFPF